MEQEHGKTEIDVEHDTSYTYSYQYAAAQTGSNVGSFHPHAPSEIGHYSFQYDSNGNQIERRYRDDDGTRQIIWDEDNRMECVHEFEHDHPHSLLPQTPASCSSTSSKESKDGQSTKNGSHTPEVRFVYNDRGERVLKESHENVSFYLNPHYTEKSDDAYKHILIGTTRLVTKEVEKETKEREDDLYYYHPDHLGSSSFVTDDEGKLEEHLEYFPFGETWIEEESSLPIAFRFTAKELDSETGLYYFGARYYDPRTSVWQSADPILNKYLPTGNLSSLAGMGGAYRPSNMSLYKFASNNPLIVTDPDGNEDVVIAASSAPQVTSRFESKALVYNDGTVNSFNVGVLKLVGAAKGLFGGKLTEKDVERVLGKPNKEYKNFSSLSDDATTKGTVAAGEIYDYKRGHTSQGLAGLKLSSSKGEGDVPQDSHFNKGVNPHHPDRNGDVVEGAFSHPAHAGDPKGTGYHGGSDGCVIGKQTTFFEDLHASKTGDRGHAIVFR